jgi:hypothetical protein
VNFFLQQVNNCGFVSWLDGSSPTTLDNALSKQWGMYNSSNCARIDDKIKHARFVQELSTEKTFEKKYSGLSGDVNKFANKTKKRVVQPNFHKINVDAWEEEMEELKNELSELKE